MEPATADVPVILRGADDPRSRFWAERAGAAAYVNKGRMGELVRALAKAVVNRREDGEFFMHLSGGGGDVRARIAQYLDTALFESVIAGEVRALASCGSFERLFDSLSQLLSQLLGYRWLAAYTTQPRQLAIHHHPKGVQWAEAEARAVLELNEEPRAFHVVDEDARDEAAGPAPMVRPIAFGRLDLGVLALAPVKGSGADTTSLISLVAAELGGAIRMTILMDESERLATIDPLTGLMNRRAFLNAVNTEFARCTRYTVPISLLVLDVDHFKAVNDTYGHAGGDRILSEVGACIKTMLRIPDLIARWGGEEFVVALTNTDLEGSTLVAERLRQTIECLSVPFEDKTIHVTVSLGLASRRDGETLEALIDRADRAMYGAKHAGRNRVVACEETPAPAKSKSSKSKQ